MTEKEKLEEAKKLYQTANADQRYVLERLFPELKKSEDEKNIKDLIDELKCSLRAANCQNEACNGGHEKRIALLEWAIAWLEKQGETSPVLSNSLNTGKSEIRGNEGKISHKWSKEDEYHETICLECVEECATQINTDFSKTIQWLKSIKQRIVQ